MKLGDALRESCVIVDVAGETKEDVLRELVSALAREHLVPDVQEALDVILEREKLGSTGIGDGIAIPHGKLKAIGTILCAFGRSTRGVPFDAVDKKPVHIFFLLLAPEDSAGLHLKMLSRISRILRDKSFMKRLMEQANARDLYEQIVREDKKFSG